MKQEQSVFTGGKFHSVLISDEPQALLAAKAAGRAVVAVEGEADVWSFRGVDYVVPSAEAAEEVLEDVVRRHLGMPWIIGVTGRLILRELTAEDWPGLSRFSPDLLPHELFQDRLALEAYIRNQYGFYEYGLWALILRENGALIGLAGLKNPELPARFRELLYAAPSEPETGSCTDIPCPETGSCTDIPWLELGYCIDLPWRRQGYGLEGAAAVMEYAHKELKVRCCACIRRDNKASRRVAEGLGMKRIMERMPESVPEPVKESTPEPVRNRKQNLQKEAAEAVPYLLYGESC